MFKIDTLHIKLSQILIFDIKLQIYDFFDIFYYYMKSN